MIDSYELFGDDRGVSPVIGVILMVAITVILAAVIGTFVLGLGDSLGGSSTAGVTVSNENVTLTSQGTADVVVIEDGGGNNIGNLSDVGDTQSISGETRPIQIIAVADGERTLIRSVE